MHILSFLPTFAGWRDAARTALESGFAPEFLFWEERDTAQPALHLFEAEAGAGTVKTNTDSRVPAAFLSIAKRAACHRDPERWALLYRILWRLVHGEPYLLSVTVDPDVHALMEIDRAVRRDVHKMRAFVRFREVQTEVEPCYIAWFEPAHQIVELNSRFFVERFASMRWSILTPDRCVHWDGKALSFTPGVHRSAAPKDDVMEALWRTYYSHIFNPARVKTRAMQAEMPKRYWKNLPETAVISDLLRKAPTRVSEMIDRSESKQMHPAILHEPEIPEGGSWEDLRDAASTCHGCPLYKNATQTVFGEGPLTARIVFLGEQPGDQEDKEGRPFVGPAGKLLDRALKDAGIERGDCYVTNAVKHFKWEPRGKRRLHQKPDVAEIGACRPWWKAELALVRPRILICLGGTAARAVFDRAMPVLKERGIVYETTYAPRTVITVHPSSIIRHPDAGERDAAYKAFVQDLRSAAHE